jgi:uncharacterized integral membrane protein
MAQPLGDPDRSGEQPATSSRTTTVEKLKWAVSAVLVVLIVLFAAANTEKRQVDYLVDSAEIPLIWVMLGSALVGAVIAALLRRRRHHRT